jgi:hypothetical protein
LPSALRLPSLEDIAAERRRRELARQTSEAVQRAGSWEAEKAKCAADPLYWFDTWVWTYDPRLIAAPGGAFVRMQLWPKQREVILWLKERIGRAEEGLLEKSRDMGATYLCAGYALHQWLFAPGFKATFGSRKVDYVDKKDNPDAIFPKIRIMLSRLPPEMLPAGFGPAHDNYMRLVNPESGAIISGEGGDDMGRGGRSSVYFLDEAAFVPNASDVEAALSGNTDCVIWVSSVNGMGNLFARKRHSILKPEARSDPDTTETAFWALGIANEINVALLNFDAVGVGAGVSSTLMKNPQRGLTVVPVNTGVDPGRLIWPDGRTSKDMFGNLKAELWWLARMAFQRTHEHVLLLQGREGGKRHPHSDLLAMPSGDRESDALALQLSLVKWGRNEKGKIVIEKKEALARRGIASPDHADAFVLNFRPPPEPDTGGLAGPMIVR